MFAAVLIALSVFGIVSHKQLWLAISTRKSALDREILGRPTRGWERSPRWEEAEENDPQWILWYQENGYLQRVDHPDWGEIPMVGCPIRLSDTPAQPGAFAPELGQHTEEVLLEHGLEWDEIVRLREDGVL